jgi:hypothetical protein
MNFFEFCIKKIAKKGKIDISGLDAKQLKIGFDVEKEHDGRMGKDTQITSNDEDTLRVCVAHLREIPDYYTKLKKAKL